MSRRLAYAFGLIALGSSGTYLFVYLFRWEWNRAFMAGVIFIAAEVGLAAVALLERIKAIEQAITEQRDPVPTAEHISATVPPSRDRFQWLKRSDVGVFIPFLLGAGVIASAVAWAVERVAGATLRPTSERRLALRLEPISLPAGGFVGQRSERITADLTVRRPNFGRSTLRNQVAALLLAILAGTIGIDVLADATKTRPDRLVPGTTTSLVVEVSLHRSGLTPSEAMDSLWGTCRSTVPNKLTDAGIVPLGDRRFGLTFTPGIGKNGFRRLHGCFEDAVLDNMQARVLPAVP